MALLKVEPDKILEGQGKRKDVDMWELQERVTEVCDVQVFCLPSGVH